MDKHVELCGRRQTFTQRCKILQLLRAFAAAQLTPDIMPKGNNRAEGRIREFACSVASLSINTRQPSRRALIACHIRFNPNRRTAMFWQYAALNLRHHSS
jgi:hypothetical protein